MMTDQDIDPNRLYTLREAAALLPSCRGGPVHWQTLRRWHQAGRMACVLRKTGKICYWFVWGSELLRLLHVDERPEWTGRTPAEDEAAYQAALGRLREQGLDIA